MIDVQIQIGEIAIKTFLLLGGGIGGFIFMMLLWRNYQDFNTARHNYMARQLQGIRRRNNDWEPYTKEEESFPPTRKTDRFVTWLLDFVYRPVTSEPIERRKKNV